MFVSPAFTGVPNERFVLVGVGSVENNGHS